MTEASESRNGIKLDINSKLTRISLNSEIETMNDYGKIFLKELSRFDNKYPAAKIGRGLMRALAKSRASRPNFASCWIIPRPPARSQLCCTYMIGDTVVKLFSLPDGAESLYHIEPVEYGLSRLELEIIDGVIRELRSHMPNELNIKQFSNVNDYLDNLCYQEIREIILKSKFRLGRTRTEEDKKIKKLTEIIKKYTGGLGLLEVLLEDNNIQDIYIDAPVDENKVYLSMGATSDPRLSSKFKTNIILTQTAAESLTTRFRYESNRPFSEAHPILECDNDAFNTRVTVIGSPISPRGIAFALRRHSDEPWTLPRLIAAKSLTALAAGLISFLLDGQSTMLIAGGRGAGKSSLLSAVMFEFAPVTRILTIEDTLELPGSIMQALGYKLQSMQIQSSVRGSGYMTADEALRVSLRLGESAIVMGEVRGVEARTLYEAMRAGTAGSAVLGTFHAESARAVFERVVYDMDISAESFSSTDIVIVAGLSRPAGLHRAHRRVLQLAELFKSAPEPGIFKDLLTYDQRKDRLVETDNFLASSERLSEIARAWNLDYNEVLSNIRTRAAIKQVMVDFAVKNGRDDVLSGRWVFRANSMFWEFLQNQYTSDKSVCYDKLLTDWKQWFRKAVSYE